MLRTLLLSSLSAILAQNAALVSSCGGAVALSGLALTPPNPQAGDDLTLNATAVNNEKIAITGGSGTINAYLWGSLVFNAPVATCGTTSIVSLRSSVNAKLQFVQFDVCLSSSVNANFSSMCLTTTDPLPAHFLHAPPPQNILNAAQGVFYGLTCPLKSGGKDSISYAMSIPQAAGGLGSLSIIFNTTDSAGTQAFCVNISVTL